MKRRCISVWVTVLIGVLAFGGCGDQSKPPLPVEVLYRASAWDQGYVLQLHNRSDRYLILRARFTNPTLEKERTRSISLGPHGRTEFGWLEGWTFASGDRVELGHEDYASHTITIP